MTHPLTPRDKVPSMPTVELTDDVLFGVSPGEVVTWAEIKRRTALASGSGDHAELALNAKAAQTWALGIYENREQAARRSTFIDSDLPATVLALLAENAALRAESESARTVVAWANNSLFGSCGYFHGDPYDGLHLARPIEALKDRATEAERKLAEAVGVLRDLSSWFDGAAHNGAWIIRAGDLGADDAICAARTFISKEAERGQ